MSAKKSIPINLYAKLRGKILNAMSKSDGPIMFNELALIMGRHRDLTRTMLARMAVAGEVESLRLNRPGNPMGWRQPADATGLAAIYAPRCQAIPGASQLRHVEERHIASPRRLSTHATYSPLASVFAV